MLAEQTVYLVYDHVIETFSGSSSLSHCSLVYELQILDSSGAYSPYIDTHVVLDSSLQQVEFQSSLLSLD